MTIVKIPSYNRRDSCNSRATVAYLHESSETLTVSLIFLPCQSLILLQVCGRGFSVTFDLTNGVTGGGAHFWT